MIVFDPYCPISGLLRNECPDCIKEIRVPEISDEELAEWQENYS